MNDADPPVTETDIPRRHRMAPEARREAILGAAQGLFFALGWDAVTVADVLAEADISKGGFYHHFAAKEDLLDHVVKRFTHGALASAESARASLTGNALERFNAFLVESSRWKADQGPAMRFFIAAMTRPGNDMLFHRIQVASTTAVRLVLAEMIAEGIAEGHFDVPDAGLVVEAILSLSQGRRDVVQAAVRAAGIGDFDDATTLLNGRMVAEGALKDRMLGLPHGSVTLSNPEEYQLMLSAIASN